MAKEQGPGGTAATPNPEDEQGADDAVFDEEEEQDVELEPVTDEELQTDPIPSEEAG